MENTKKLKFYQFTSESAQNKKQNDDQMIRSSHSESYLTFFKSISKYKIDRAKMENNLEIAGIHIEDSLPSTKQTTFRIKQIKQGLSSQVQELTLSYGHLSTKIKLLIIPILINLKKFYLYNEGSFGAIYLAFDKQKQVTFAIKTILVPRGQKWIHILKELAKQYFMALLMSSLQIGPKLQKYFGFDIIAYPNCILFTMEYCQPKKIVYQQCESQLKQALRLMHSLKIVHFDIKPQNIAFSSIYKKWVFIDFGLSSIIFQPFGTLAKVNFIGTFQYCSQQMKQTISCKNYVDLYYNDVYSLQKSLKALKKTADTLEQLEECRSKSINPYLQCENANFKIDQIILLLKYSIVVQNLHIFEVLARNIDDSIVLNQICRFLTKIVPTNFVRKVYFQNIQNKFKANKYKAILDIRLRKLFNFIKIQPCELNNLAQTLKQQLLFDVGEQQSFKISEYKCAIALKIALTSEKTIREVSKEKYYEMCFKYITFQSNLYDATLFQKYQVAAFFLQKIKCLQDLEENQIKLTQQFQLRHIILFLEQLIEYCSSDTFNTSKINLFSQVILQYLLINQNIFTNQNCQNLFHSWYRAIYQSNKQNFFEMIYKLFRLRQGYKFLWYQSRPVYYQNYQLANLNESLFDVWQDKEYLHRHLKNDLAIEQFLKIISFTKYVPNAFQYLDKYGYFQEKLLNQKGISLFKKKYIRTKIEIQYFFITIWSLSKNKIMNLLISFQLLEKVQSNKLCEQHFHFCAYTYKIQDYLKCHQILKKIDKLINCSRISSRFFKVIRFYLAYYLQDKSFSLQMYEKCVQIISQNFVINEHSYQEIIGVYESIFHNVKPYILTETTLRKQTIIMLKLVQKLKRITQNIIIFMQRQRKQDQILGISMLFRMLDRCIRFIPKTKFIHKSYFYDTFLYYTPQCMEVFQKYHIQRVNQLESLIIFSKCAKLNQQRKFQQTLVYLQLTVLQNLAPNFTFQTYPQLIEPFIFFLKLFYALQKTSMSKIQQIYRNNQENFSAKRQINKNNLQEQPSFAVKFKNVYLLVLKQIYQYLQQSRKFGICVVYNAPTIQIIQNLYLQKQAKYQQIFNFLYHYTGYLKSVSNSQGVPHIIQSLHYLYIQLEFYLNEQFLNSFFKAPYHKETIFSNPHWWILVNVFIGWSKSHYNLLYKVAICFQYLKNQVKNQILGSFYMNMIRRQRIYLNSDLTEKVLLKSCKKIKNNWLTYAKNLKINLSFTLFYKLRIKNLNQRLQKNKLLQIVNKIYTQKLKNQYKNAYNIE